MKYKTTLTRIIFTYDTAGNVILLETFIKTHKRKTDAALASALAKMRRIELNPAYFLLAADISDYFKKIAEASAMYLFIHRHRPPSASLFSQHFGSK